jgi:hypothetical protein
MDYLQMLVVANDGSGEILAATSSDGVNWWNGTGRSAGFVKTGHATQTTPALVAWPNRASTYGNFTLAMLGQNNNNLFWRGSSDGVHWSGGAINQSSNLSPSLMYYYVPNSSGASPWLGFVAANSSNELLVCSSTEGVDWSANTPINQTSKLPPAFTGMIDYYVMLFVSNDSSNRLLACSTKGSGTWSGASDTGQQSKAAPSITGLGSNLWMAFLSNDSSNEILVCSSADGISWSGATKIGQQSSTAPSITTSGNELWIAFVANNSSHDVLVCSSTDGIHWSGNSQVGQQSPVAPAIAGFNFKLLPILG